MFAQALRCHGYRHFNCRTPTDSSHVPNLRTLSCSSRSLEALNHMKPSRFACAAGSANYGTGFFLGQVTVRNFSASFSPANKE